MARAGWGDWQSQDGPGTRVISSPWAGEPSRGVPPEPELERWGSGQEGREQTPGRGKHPPRQEAAHFGHLEDCGLSMKGQEKEGRGERRSSFTPS